MQLGILVLTVTVFYLGIQDEALATNDKIHIEYTVENTLLVAPLFSETLKMQTTTQPFYNIMKEAERMNKMFRFVSIHYPRGQYITTVNDLEEIKPELYWVGLLRDHVHGDCYVPKGPSQYVPRNGQHVVVSYQSYSTFQELPTCHDV